MTPLQRMGAAVTLIFVCFLLLLGVGTFLIMLASGFSVLTAVLTPTIGIAVGGIAYFLTR